ncbi:MAG TPA: AgmX/PglI C-terminal domain-containing protein [Gammaproteobacteria bacterium]|nr:AgmX/PglI C-terminal domain-containing protein [Gammaproteobacteria bacterium]
MSRTNTYVVAPAWSTTPEEKAFNRLVTGLMFVTFILSIGIGFIRLPEVPREVQERLPVRLAQIIMEKRKPKPKPVVIQDPVELEPKEKKIEKKVEKKKPVEKIKVPVEQTVQQAREKAKSSGILAFQDELSDMRDAIDTRALKKTTLVQRGSGEATRLDRSLLTTKGEGRRANVNISNLSRTTGGVALAGRETTVVDAPDEETALNSGAVRLANSESQPARSIEEVRRVFDANKGAIFAIYNRALRRNPGLLGKVVLELVIEPDGTVSDCRIISTEMEDDEMVNKLVRRVQMFDFGDKAVVVTRISYPVHFLPS